MPKIQTSVVLKSAFCLTALTLFLALLNTPGTPTLSKSLFHRPQNQVEIRAYPLRSSPQDEAWQHELKLRFHGTQFPEAYHLTLATYQKTITLLSSEITSSSCTWKPAANSKLEDNKTLSWVKSTDCRAGDASELTLRLVTKEPSPVAIWTAKFADFQVATDVPALVVTETTDSSVAALLGSVDVLNSRPASPRWTLLAYVWGDQSHWGLCRRLLLALGVGFIACFLPSSMKFPGLWLSLTLLQATITPPFQAPDEPDHFLSYSVLTKNPELAKGALDLANLGHFQRIKFHPQEKFTSNDLGNPMKDQQWDGHIYATDMETRSPLAALLWKLYAKVSIDRDTSSQLWGLRCFQSFAVAVCLWLGSVLYSLQSRTYVAFLMLGTSLSFFSFHVSNYFSSLGLGVLVGFVIADLLGGARIRLGGYLAFFATAGLLPYTSAIGVAAVILTAALAPLVILSFTRFQEESLSPLEKCAPLLGSFMLLAPVLWFEADGRRAWQFIFTTLTNLPRKDVVDPRHLPLYLIYITLAFWVPVAWLAKGRMVRFQLQRIVAPLVLMVWSLAWLFVLAKPMEYLMDIENPQADISRWKYVGKAMVFAWTSLFPGRPDFYISASFWAGFGWLEAIPGAIWIGVAAMPCGTGLVLLCLKGFKSQRQRDMLVAIYILVSLSAMLAYMALDRWNVRVNLHGRYLIIFYLGLMAAAFIGWSRFGREKSKAWLQGESWAYLAVIFHLGATAFLLNRYF